MRNDKFTELLRLENDFKNDSFFFQNIDFWPWIRIVIGYNESLRISPIDKQGIDRFSEQYTFKQKLGLAWYYFKKYRSQPKIETDANQDFKKADVLFVSHELHCRKVQGSKINVWIHLFEQQIKQNNNISTEIYKSSKNSAFLQRVKKKHFKQMSFSFLLSSIGIKQKDPLQNNSIQKLVSALNHSSFGVTFSSGELRERMLMLAMMIEEFTIFFRKNKPKVIFLYAYYMDEFLALCHAARELGIVVVEIQHGLIKPKHFAYTDWIKRADEKKYFLPTYCLTHDNETANCINRSWLNGIKAYFVGNSNIALELLEKSIPERIKLFKDEDVNKTHVLVTTSNNHFISAEFIRVINNANENIVWHFKLHLRYTTLEMYLKYKEMFSNVNVRVYFENTYSVYDFFSLCSIHVTEESYVAIEAEAFGLTNIILGGIGADVFTDQISKNNFYSCLNAEEFITVLNKMILQKKHQIQDSMVHDFEKNTKYFLNEILKIQK